MLAKWIGVPILATLIASGLFSCPRAHALTSAPASLKSAGVISFCTELGQPPAAYIAADGVTPEGFEVDIMKAIGAELGLKTTITNYKFAGILAALDSNKCDAVMASTAVTAERLKKYNFVEYMQGTSGLLVRTGNPQGLRTFEDLSGKRVAVLLGSANERRLKEASARLVSAGKAPLSISAYSSNVVAFKELDLGRVDAFVSGTLTLSYYMARADGRFEVGGTPVPPTPFGIMLPRAEVDKAQAIRAAYATLVKNGAIDKIVTKWGAEEGGALCNGACVLYNSGAGSDLNRGGEPLIGAEPAGPKKTGVQFDLPFFLSFVLKPPPALLHGLVITVVSAAVSLIIGAVLGALLGIGGISRFRSLQVFNQAFIAFFRGTPVLVQLVLVYFGVPALLGGIDLFPPTMQFPGFTMSGALVAGVVTFSLHEAAYMSEIFRAGIQSIDVGQTEAAKSLGMPPGMTMRRIILPQALRVIVPPLGNQFNIMLKTTSLLSVIAIPELFHVADAVQSATYKSFEVYLGVSVYYLVLTGAWTLVQREIEARIKRGNAKFAAVASVGPRTNGALDKQAS
jgi:polar amino acid transport system permease protein